MFLRLPRNPSEEKHHEGEKKSASRSNIGAYGRRLHQAHRHGRDGWRGACVHHSNSIIAASSPASVRLLEKPRTTFCVAGMVRAPSVTHHERGLGFGQHGAASMRSRYICTSCRHVRSLDRIAAWMSAIVGSCVDSRRNAPASFDVANSSSTFKRTNRLIMLDLQIAHLMLGTAADDPGLTLLRTPLSYF